MTSAAPVVAIASDDRLGESPVWDDRTSSLWRVDAVAGAVARLDVATDHEQRFHVGWHVGSLVLREDGKRVLLAAQGGFYSLDTGTGAVALLAAVQADDPQIVMNDGACDPAGRFVAGSQAPSPGPAPRASTATRPRQARPRCSKGPVCATDCAGKPHARRCCGSTRCSAGSSDSATTSSAGPSRRAPPRWT